MENSLRMKYVLRIMRVICASIISLYLIKAAANDFSGNVKAYGISRNTPAYDSLEHTLQLSTKLQYLKTLSEKTNFEMAYELTTFTEKPKFHSTQKNAYRVLDFKTYLHDEKPGLEYETLVAQNLNRLNVNTKLTLMDINIGRMPIAFGSSKSLNPTDVLAPFAINAIDKEERTGVDTLQLKIPFSEVSLMEIGIIAGEDFEKKKSAAYLRPRFNLNEFEVVLTAMHFEEKNLLGFDVQHPISDAGFWFETAFVDQKSVPVLAINDFVRVTTGIDYKFASTLYLSGEYHFNGASGNNNPFNPLDFIYLRDKHYFIGTASYEFTPLITGSMQTYFNSKDQSTLSLLKADYNVIENAYMSLGSFYTIGNKSTTEFARLGKTFYTSLRYYY